MKKNIVIAILVLLVTMLYVIEIPSEGSEVEFITLEQLKQFQNNELEMTCWTYEGGLTCLPDQLIWPYTYWQYYAGIVKEKSGGHGMGFDHFIIEVDIGTIPTNYYSKVNIGDCIEIRCEPGEEGGICILQSIEEDPLSKYYPFSCER